MPSATPEPPSQATSRPRSASRPPPAARTSPSPAPRPRRQALPPPGREPNPQPLTERRRSPPTTCTFSPCGRKKECGGVGLLDREGGGGGLELLGELFGGDGEVEADADHCPAVLG